MISATGACQSRPSPAAPTATAPREIAAFGDSLTAGYGIAPTGAFPAVLQDYLRREGLPFTVVNAGVSGDTTSSALSRLPGVLARKPAIVIVALGANDGLRGVPVAVMRENLSRVIREAKASGARVILCGMEALPLYGWSSTLEFHNAFVELAREHDVPLVPFFMAKVVRTRRPAARRPLAPQRSRIARDCRRHLALSGDCGSQPRHVIRRPVQTAHCQQQ